MNLNENLNSGFAPNVLVLTLARTGTHSDLFGK
ncbi:type II toxin-antitoxin system YafQ family toxin [Blautia obeum]|jgi:mRNA-degrading endonuclease YafQ of YafQ-DinJ toxin-antitoxin module|nr:type II toxin-antitoxin system YafQ family toxin [Blautia obeum]